MPCSKCKQIGHNIRTCPTHKYVRPQSPIVPAPVSNQIPKKTRNRDEKIPSSNWLISNSILLKCERIAKDYPIRKKMPKIFLKTLYNTEMYIKALPPPGNRSKVNRGNLAKNWKRNGKYICPSLHKADNIYQTLGKKVWCEEHKGLPANTWKSVDIRFPDHELRCSVCPTPFSKKWVEGGRQCLRKTCGPNSKCTQHYKLT